MIDLLSKTHELDNLSCREIEHLLNKRGDFLDILKRDGTLRPQFVRRFSWSIPCKEVIEAFKRFARPPIIDPMAGTGFMAKLLTKNGMHTIASDLHISRKYNHYRHSPRHMKIKRQHALKAVLSMWRYGGQDIILSWPPYDEPIGYEIIKLLPVGSRVFYFGESYGATGTDAMHKLLDSDYENLAVVNLPQFWGLHDNLMIYERKLRS